MRPLFIIPIIIILVALLASTQEAANLAAIYLALAIFGFAGGAAWDWYQRR